MIKLTVTGWEDGERKTRELDAPDRWMVHAAEHVTVQIGKSIKIELEQEPRSISARRMGVGAVLWDGSLALAAYLARQPLHRYVGLRCLELGAGVGLVGLTLTAMGAKVYITDKEAVLPLTRRNAMHNGHDPETTMAGARGPAAIVRALEWGSPEVAATVQALAAADLELIVAADVCYVDQDGVSPSTTAFVATCAALCKPHTQVLVCQELRSEAVRQALVQEAAKHFSVVTKLPGGALPAAVRADHLELFELRL